MCSTYSTLTSSGPRMKTARVLGPSTKFWTSSPPRFGFFAMVLRGIYQAADVKEHASPFGRLVGEAYTVIARLHGGGVVSWGEAHRDE